MQRGYWFVELIHTIPWMRSLVALMMHLSSLVLGLAPQWFSEKESSDCVLCVRVCVVWGGWV